MRVRAPPRPMYYDKQGRQITRERWSELAERGFYKNVLRHRLDMNVMVSTVWLGLDHGYGDHRQIFETMSFEDMIASGASETVCKRYATAIAAIIGHFRVLRRVCKRHGFPAPREAHGPVHALMSAFA